MNFFNGNSLKYLIINIGNIVITLDVKKKYKHVFIISITDVMFPTPSFPLQNNILIEKSLFLIVLFLHSN